MLQKLNQTESRLELTNAQLKRQSRRVVELSELHRQSSRKKSRMQLKIQELVREARTRQNQYDQLKNKAQALSSELAIIRSRLIVRIVSRLVDRVDLRYDIHPAFQQLMDDSSIFLPKLDRLLLQPGPVLNEEGTTYRFRVDRPQLCEILACPILELPTERGVLKLDVCETSGVVLAQATRSVESIRDDRPTVFRFPPIATSADRRLVCHLRPRGIDAPVRVWHWVTRNPLRFGSLRRRPFFGYRFASAPGDNYQKPPGNDPGAAQPA